MFENLRGKAGRKAKLSEFFRLRAKRPSFDEGWLQRDLNKSVSQIKL